jgi:hypothetical protein
MNTKWSLGTKDEAEELSHKESGRNKVEKSKVQILISV